VPLRFAASVARRALSTSRPSSRKIAALNDGDETRRRMARRRLAGERGVFKHLLFVRRPARRVSVMLCKQTLYAGLSASLCLPPSGDISSLAVLRRGRVTSRAVGGRTPASIDGRWRWRRRSGGRRTRQADGEARAGDLVAYGVGLPPPATSAHCATRASACQPAPAFCALPPFACLPQRAC